MAEELFWYVYNDLKESYPKFFKSNRSYPGLPHRIKRTLFAFDSTTIQLTANSLDWAKHRRRKAAAKAHTSLNMQSFLPEVIIVKSAKDSDPKTAPELCSGLKAGETAVFLTRNMLISSTLILLINEEYSGLPVKKKIWSIKLWDSMRFPATEM